jgi:hypothetical protein
LFYGMCLERLMNDILFRISDRVELEAFMFRARSVWMKEISLLSELIMMVLTYCISLLLGGDSM